MRYAKTNPCVTGVKRTISSIFYSSLYVCMVSIKLKYNFVDHVCLLWHKRTDETSGGESSKPTAIVNLRGVSTKLYFNFYSIATCI